MTGPLDAGLHTASHSGSPIQRTDTGPMPQSQQHSRRSLAGAVHLRLACLAIVLAWGSHVQAGSFNPELQVSGGNGLATGAPSINVDFIDQVFLTWIEDGEVWAVGGVDLSGGSMPATASGLEHADPHVHRATTPVATIVFQRDLLPGNGDPEIFYITNIGGTFGTPFDLSQDPLVDQHPYLACAPFGGDLDVVWERLEGGVFPSIYYSIDLGPPVAVAEGEYPVIAIGTGGGVHLAYSREFDIYYRLDQGAGFGTELLVSTDPTLDVEADVAVDGMSVPHVVFTGSEDIRYRRGDGFGGFEPLLNLSSSVDPSSRPQIVIADDVVYVIYQEDGDLFLTSGDGSVFSLPENLTATPEPEEDPQIVVDSLGNLHVTYRRGGEIYYRNNAEPPQPSFAATPTTGEQPLTVEFTSTSTGVIASHLWEFGDGGFSTQENPTYTYENTGTYDVTLTTVGPAGTFSVTEQNFIAVTSPSNVMRVPPVTAFQGQPDIYVPVLGTHAHAMQGCQISLTWDCTTIDLVDVTLEATDFFVLDPEFFVPNIDVSGSPCFFTMGLVIDTAPPFDGRTLAPGVDQRLLNLIVDVPFTTPAPSTTTIDLEHGFGDPPIFNIFTVDGSSVVPVLEDGDLTIIPFELPLPLLFIRGDANLSGTLNIVDPVLVLNYLFSQGAPPCFDAADIDDSGTLDLVDAIASLGFIFGSGGIPPVPYPLPGLDPTPDSLPGC